MAENVMNEQQQSVEDRIAGFLEAEEAPQQETAPVQKQEQEQEVATEQDEETKESDAEETADVVSNDEEVEEIQIASVQQLAEHLGTDVSELYNLTLPVTGADGQKHEVALGEWKDSYQASEKVKAEQDAIVSARKAFEEEAQQQKQAVEERFFTASKMIEAVESQLVGGLDNAQMEQLRVQDPAEYAAIKQDYTERLNGISAVKQQFAQEYYQYQQGIAQQTETERGKWAEQENQRIGEVIPEWANEEVRTKETAEMNKYLASQGYPDEIIQGSLSAVDKSLARKAMLYDRQQKARPEMKKKVVSIGKKVLKSGKSKSKAELSTEQAKADYKKFQKDGSLGAAASYVEKHLLGEM